MMGSVTSKAPEVLGLKLVNIPLSLSAVLALLCLIVLKVLALLCHFSFEHFLPSWLQCCHFHGNIGSIFGFFNAHKKISWWTMLLFMRLFIIFSLLHWITFDRCGLSSLAAQFIDIYVIFFFNQQCEHLFLVGKGIIFIAWPQHILELIVR